MWTLATIHAARDAPDVYVRVYVHVAETLIIL